MEEVRSHLQLHQCKIQKLQHTIEISPLLSPANSSSSYVAKLNADCEAGTAGYTNSSRCPNHPHLHLNTGCRELYFGGTFPRCRYQLWPQLVVCASYDLLCLVSVSLLKKPSRPQEYNGAHNVPCRSHASFT